MINRLWFLLTDSVLEANCGAGDSMDNAIRISLELFCEAKCLDTAKIYEEIKRCEAEAYEAIDNRIEYQSAAIELIEFKLMKLKNRIDKGEFKYKEGGQPQ